MPEAQTTKWTRVALDTYVTDATGLLLITSSPNWNEVAPHDSFYPALDAIVGVKPNYEYAVGDEPAFEAHVRWRGRVVTLIYKQLDYDTIVAAIAGYVAALGIRRHLQSAPHDVRNQVADALQLAVERGFVREALHPELHVPGEHDAQSTDDGG